MKKIIPALLIVFLLTSCKTVIVRLMGVKKPRPTTNEQVIQYVKDHGSKLDHDYLLRPKSDSDIVLLNKHMKIGFNSIVLYDSAGNEIANTNDSNCHMNLRGQVTYLLEHGGYTPSFFSKSERKELDARTICLNCSNGKGIFENERKPYVLFFSIARFIPLKPKLTDVDYIQELEQKALRDKVTIVLLDEDLHP